MEYVVNGVNGVFQALVEGFYRQIIPTVRTSSRNGDVLKAAHPVLVTYTQPWQRVLFNAERDANPFFHLFEALWMLSGSDRVEPIAKYNQRMKDYSDDGQTFHGAYGHRWREAFGFDQLSTIADALRKNSECRRQVLSVWHGSKDLGVSSADLPCNTHAYFSVREAPLDVKIPPQPLPGFGVADYVPGRKVLDMTVCNRSNDLIWGMLGANVVHWSMLLEYMAARIGVEVGRYYHFTNNLHVYCNNWEPEKWMGSNILSSYCGGQNIERFPLVQSPAVFDYEVGMFVANGACGTWDEPFLEHVAKPMCYAFGHHKQRNYAEALAMMKAVEALDWQIAGTAWIERRKANWESKQKG